MVVSAWKNENVLLNIKGFRPKAGKVILPCFLIYKRTVYGKMEKKKKNNSSHNWCLMTDYEYKRKGQIWPSSSSSPHQQCEMERTVCVCVYTEVYI